MGAVRKYYDRREGVVVLSGYVLAGCLEDGAWMLWQNSSAAVAVAVVVARFFLDKFSK